jgi:hypothetical protein
MVATGGSLPQQFGCFVQQRVAQERPTASTSRLDNFITHL